MTTNSQINDLTIDNLTSFRTITSRLEGFLENSVMCRILNGDTIVADIYSSTLDLSERQAEKLRKPGFGSGGALGSWRRHLGSLQCLPPAGTSPDRNVNRFSLHALVAQSMVQRLYFLWCFFLGSNIPWKPGESPSMISAFFRQFESLWRSPDI